MPHTYDQEIQSLIRLAGNVTDAFTAALFLVDERRRDRLTLTACQSLSNNIIPNAVIRVGHGLVGWVAKHERSANAKNFRHDTTTLQFYATDENIKSFAAAPILDGDRLIGVLSVDSKQEYVFTDKKVKLLAEFAETFARVITLGKKRIRLHAEAADMNALCEIAEIVSDLSGIKELEGAMRRHCPSLIAHDHLAIAARLSDDQEYHLLQGSGPGEQTAPLPLTHYRLGWVVRQARAIHLPSLDAPVIPGDDNQWRSFIGAPMISNGQVIGAIGLMSRKPGSFRQADLKPLAILASILSSTLASFHMTSKARAAAMTDPLTKTLTFQALLQRRASMAPAGIVAVVDLKGFAHVNDELGLIGGDKVLVELARRLGSVVSGEGNVCRYYSDRFIITLPDTKRPQAAPLLQKVTATIDAAPFHYEGTDIHITPVIGAAACPGDGETVEELTLKAMRAADRAKRHPGARVVFFSDPDAPESVHLQSLK